MEQFIKSTAIFGTLGICRSLFEERLAAGLFTEPLPRPDKGPGERVRLWPKSEVEIIVQATFAGYTDDQMRDLVKRLMDRRKKVADELREVLSTL